MFADDVTIIGVASRAGADSYLDWVTTYGVDGFEHVADEEGAVWREYGVTTQPAFSFINGDGTVDIRFGAMGVDGLTERINELIAS